MTSGAGPFTGGYERVLPKDEIIVIANDPPPGATAVYADPENYRGLHSTMVPLKDRVRFWFYRGYYLCVRLNQIETEFEMLADTD